MGIDPYIWLSICSTSTIYIYIYIYVYIYISKTVLLCNYRAFSEGVAATNKIRGGQAFRTLPYSVELRPKWGTFEPRDFLRGFVFDERHVSCYVVIYIYVCLYI